MIDLCCVVWSYLLAVYLRFHSLHEFGRDDIHIIIIFCILLFYVIYSSIIENNRGFLKRGYYVEFMAVAKCNVCIFIIWGCSLFLFKEAEDFSRGVFGYYFICSQTITYVLHLLFKQYLRLYYKMDRAKIKVMVITDYDSAQELLPDLLKNTDYDYEITSLTILDRDVEFTYIHEIPVVANAVDMLDIARQLPLDEVFLYLPGEDRNVIKQIIMDFETMGIVCHYNLDVADLDVRARSLGNFGGFTVITYELNPIDYKHRMIKRAIDIVGSLAGLLITAVIFPFVALAIKIDSRGPVLFSQVRVGKNGRRFKIYKFRSMHMDAEERKKELEEQNEIKGLMFKMGDDPRVTRVGKFIRKTSIDELPQFFNVLKGDMSLVGTRPPTEDEFERYSPYYRRRLCMTPGLTGLWQVSGRSDVQSFDEVVKFDLHYIDYWSLSLDIKIIFQTIFVVIFGRGAK